MKSTVEINLTILALVLGFVSGGVGTFYGLSFWDSHIMHDHDSPVGINYFLFAFAGATLCAVVVGILVGRCLWPTPSPPEDGSNQSSQS